jgi:hypothetical protein
VTDTRELRIASVLIDGVTQVQIGYWRRKGVLLVPSGNSLVIDGRDLDRLIVELACVQATMAAIGRRS